MKTLILRSITALALVLTSVSVYADDAAQPAPAPAPAPVTAPAVDPSSYNGLLQKKYNLTDAQVQTLNDSKLPDSQKAQVAQLAKSSGKSIEEVLKMRTEDKMGWGKIAKTLGVHPGELGKAVSEMKKERNAERKKEKSGSMESSHEGMGHGKPDHAGGGHGKGKNK